MPLERMVAGAHGRGVESTAATVMGKTVGEKRCENEFEESVLVVIVALAAVPSIHVRVRGIGRLEDTGFGGLVVSRLTLCAHVIKTGRQTDI